MALACPRCPIACVRELGTLQCIWCQRRLGIGHPGELAPEPPEPPELEAFEACGDCGATLAYMKDAGDSAVTRVCVHCDRPFDGV